MGPRVGNFFVKDTTTAAIAAELVQKQRHPLVRRRPRQSGELLPRVRKKFAAGMLPAVSGCRTHRDGTNHK